MYANNAQANNGQPASNIPAPQIPAARPLPPPNDPNFSIWLGCYKLKNPNPVKIVGRILLYDAIVFCVELVVSLIFLFTRPRVNVFSAILQILIIGLIICATILNIRGLELAVRAKRLHQKLCCYNVARVAYFILLTLNAISYLVGFLYPSYYLPVWIKVWGGILIALCVIGFSLQPAMYAFASNYTSVAPPGSSLVIIQRAAPGYPTYGQPAPSAPGYPTHALPPGWGQPIQYPSQQPIQMQEINLNDQRQSPSQPTYNFGQANKPQPFEPYRGTGVTIDGKAEPVKQDATPKVK